MTLQVREEVPEHFCLLHVFQMFCGNFSRVVPPPRPSVTPPESSLVGASPDDFSVTVDVSYLLAVESFMLALARAYPFVFSFNIP